jgi:hypothetical protein
MNARLRTWITGIIAVLIVWTPRVGAACAVCSAGQEDETRLAFILTTAFMTVLPLAMLGGLFLWLRKRARELDESARGEPEPARSQGPAQLAPVSRASSSL